MKQYPSQWESMIINEINKVDNRIKANFQPQQLKIMLEWVKESLEKHLKEDCSLISKKIEWDLKNAITKLKIKIEQINAK